MDIVGTIILALLIGAPTVYVIVSRLLEKRRIKEAISVESSADSAPVDVSAPELDTQSAVSYLKTSAGTGKAYAARGTQPRRIATRPHGSAYRLHRIEKLPPLKRAIVWSELLKPPPGIYPGSTDRFL